MGRGANAVDEWKDAVALRKAAHGLAKPYEAGPEFVSWGPFNMDAKGLTTEVTKGRGDNARTETIWIASAFEIIGACRDPNGRSWGKWLRWRDADGRVHSRHVSDAALQGDPSVLCGGLADEGLSINRNQQRSFLTYLSDCNVKGRVTIVHRTGWHDISGHQVFVLPAETIGPKGSEQVILDASAVGPYETKGTLKETLLPAITPCLKFGPLTSIRVAMISCAMLGEKHPGEAMAECPTTIARLNII